MVNDFKSYLLENKINILDSNEKFQLNNFMEIIIRDTEIKELYIYENEDFDRVIVMDADGYIYCLEINLL